MDLDENINGPIILVRLALVLDCWLLRTFPLIHALLLFFVDRPTQISSDGQRFEVPGHVANLSALIKDTIGDADDEDGSEGDNTPIEIELINVTSDALALVVQFFLHYMEEEMTPITVSLSLYLYIYPFVLD
jgi:Skp1 family, tetramerisation domain